MLKRLGLGLDYKELMILPRMTRRRVKGSSRQLSGLKRRKLNMEGAKMDVLRRKSAMIERGAP